MKARFKTGLRQEICVDYPDCDCVGHMVFEQNKRKKLIEVRENDSKNLL